MVRRQTTQNPCRVDQLLSHGTQLTRAQFLPTLIIMYHLLGLREAQVPQGRNKDQILQSFHSEKSSPPLNPTFPSGSQASRLSSAETTISPFAMAARKLSIQVSPQLPYLVPWHQGYCFSSPVYIPIFLVLILVTLRLCWDSALPLGKRLGMDYKEVKQTQVGTSAMKIAPV